jgi:hypothetical protein
MAGNDAGKLPAHRRPRIDAQRVANEMFQFHMLSQPFKVSTMLGAL